MDFLLQLLVVGGTIGVLDGLWLGLVVKRFYASQIGNLLLPKPNMFPAGLFYVVYVVGVVMFVVRPALDIESWVYAVSYGGLLGLVAYATYDLTNLATLKGFKVKLALVDIVWGVVLTASASTVGYFVMVLL